MPVIFNRGRFWSEWETNSPEDNFQYAHAIGDAVHTESAVRFLGQPFEHINEQCVFGRSIDLPVWTWVEYPMLPFSYVPPPPLEAKIKAAKVVANGGRPMLWSMPCAPMLSQTGMAGVRDVFKLVAGHSEIFNNVKFDKFAGIVFSSTSLRTLCQGDSHKMDAYRKTFAGAQQLMIRNHVPYDFILDEQLVLANLKKYRAIVLPDVICLGRAACKNIETYVRNGGTVFATYRTSLYREDGTRRKQFALKDLFGAKYIKDLGEQLKGWSAAYARFHADHQTNRAGLKENLFPIGGRYLAVEAEGIARLLKRCRYYCDYPQEETAYPAIIAREFGKGRVVYIPGEFFKLYHEKGFLQYSQFFAQSLEWLTGGTLPVSTNLPDTVELTMAKDRKGRRIVHLINCTFDKTRPVKAITPISGCYLKIRTGKKNYRAVDITTGKALKLRKENDAIKLNLPALTGYNVIVLS
jgi:hypothetical protein